MPDPPPPPATLDLRLVWCFTVVAEHRHFGRAAEALHTTQPSLSRQIHRLERQLGARLFARTPHGNHLTEAGEVFLPLATALLRSADRAAARTRAAALPSRITIGYTPGIIITPAVRELRREHPEAEVRTLHLAADAPRPALLDHRVDAVVTRLPLRTEGLDVTALHDEPRVLVVPRDHRLAGRESVTLDDIADEPLPKVRGADPLLSAFWRIDPRPDGSPAPDGPLVEADEDKYELVAAGQAVTVSAGVRARTLRPDLTTVPLEGVEPSHVILATRDRDRNRLVAAFRRHARAHLAGQPGGSGDPRGSGTQTPRLVGDGQGRIADFREGIVTALAAAGELRHTEDPLKGP
ncbi:LysR family transcriptional regulator [Streptomyces sp. HNM0663]|uniref:LysR family transcriptional regulator n=1 Tax=Streptomyces chengmaiensis TaxID=3040919 RepID=A0ABT6HTE7_9ACTN|nr:LysR family transcriptional regulator [Streptomyces chengmaiensis]MDH2391129.1 LysR family transcriptional regulator [Streptomyces chengmaiensis]